MIYLIGIPGLIPFYLCFYNIDLIFLEFDKQMFVHYSTVILSFLALHFYDFWIPEMEYKYIEFKPDDPNRYHHELVEKFQDPIKVGFYCVSFVFLALHLVHGLASSTQSLGTSNKYSSLIKKISYSFGIVVPLGFCFIAIYHFLSH